MLIRKEKNFIFVLILGIILIIIGLIYGLIKSDIGVLLLFVIFGILLVVLATVKNIIRYKNLKKLKDIIKNKEYILGHVSTINKVSSGGTKIIKETIYEIIVELEIEGLLQILVSDWIDDEYIKEYNIEKKQEVEVYFLNNKNYYFKFKKASN